VGCNITATKGALVYAGGEARTSATGTADLQSRTTVFRIQNSGTLRFQNVTDAITLVTLWFGRLFVAHDPQGRDVVTVNAGGTRVVAVDTLFTMVVTGTANLGDGDVYVAVAAGGGSVQVTLASGATGELLHGQQLTIPAGAQALPPPQLISPVEQAEFDAVITAWRQTPGLVLPTSPEFVPQTGYRVADKFLPYWTSHDGPRLLGYPVSEEFYAPSILDQGASAGLQAFQATPGPHLYASQCFERALMEFHPENAGSPYIVEGALLGRFSYRARYGDAGAAGQVPNQTPDDSHYFPETGHWVGGRFWHYWQEHGGLAQHGYPLSDEFTETSLLDGTSYTVQYFERSVFEYHPEFAGSDFEVSLTQLGTYYCRGGALPTLTPTATETPTLTPTATSTPVPTATETPTDTPTPGPGGHLGPTYTPVPPSPTPTPPVPCGWVVAAVGLLGSHLYDITAVAANDIWAGGVDYFGGTLLVHWNGSAWSQEPSPSNGSTEIRGLAATAGNDVWAVGTSNTGGPQLPYILHWDGSTWSVVPSPAPPGSLLFDVVAVAANDAWAVGQTGSNALALHWNGVSWSPVALPALGSPSSLHAITVLGPNNIWAVGVVYSGNLPRTLVEHWDGVSWSVVPSPNTADPNDEDTLSGVAALTASDIWAVGYYYEAVSGATKMLTEHWNGVSWTLVPGPNLPAWVDGYPADVAVLSPSDAWAVGWSYDGVQHQTLALHWDGVQWTINPTPNPPGAASLEALVALGANDILAVGGGGVGIGAFLEHYLGPCAPSPTPTP
jgi:hypothetical protein